MIRFHGADVVGLQEALRGQITDLEAALPQFGWFGSGRVADRGGEHSAVLFRKDRLEVLAESTFWLSETPAVAGSRSWDAALPRIVTWAKLRDRRDGTAFHLFNTHFDHLGEAARRESARLLLRKIAEIAGPDGPVLVTGDFNTTPDSEPYRILTAGRRPGGLPASSTRSSRHRARTTARRLVERLQGDRARPAHRLRPLPAAGRGAAARDPLRHVRRPLPLRPPAGDRRGHDRGAEPLGTRPCGGRRSAGYGTGSFRRSTASAELGPVAVRPFDAVRDLELALLQQAVDRLAPLSPERRQRRAFHAVAVTACRAPCESHHVAAKVPSARSS